MDGYFVWQIIGLIALALQIFWFLEKNDKRFFVYLSTSSFFWGIHYLMIGLISWWIVNLIDVIKNIFWYKRIKSNILFWLLCIVYTVLWIYFFDGTFLWLLPSLASVLSIYAIFFSKWENLRIYYGIITFIWLIYSIFGFSIAGSVTSILLLWELLYTYLKIHKQKKIYKQKINSILSNK